VGDKVKYCESPNLYPEHKEFELEGVVCEVKLVEHETLIEKINWYKYKISPVDLTRNKVWRTSSDIKMFNL
jgi:hypothetical protein